MKDKKKGLQGNRFIKATFSRENIEAIFIAVILAFFIRTFVVQAFKIPSGSMEPTLLIGDHILVNKFIYGINIPFIEKKFFQFKKPVQDDVIVFIYPVDPSKDFIKRVIAVGGDTITIKDKKIYVNDQPFNDTHGYYSDRRVIKEWDSGATRDNFGPIKVPSDSIFVMGDNRDKSYDSRFWGFVNINKVKGKAFLVYWSWESPFKDFRWKRLGSLIQ
ncbi:MAG: signal peptidase I [Pseudomonadota bacterium]